MGKDINKGTMTLFTFDTYDAIKRLCSSGLSTEQAEEIVRAILESRTHDFSNWLLKNKPSPSNLSWKNLPLRR